MSGKSVNARPAWWPVTQEPRSIWAKIASAVAAARRVRPGRACCAGIGPFVARSAMRITRREDGQRHPEVGGDELGGKALEHDGGAEQRLDDDEEPGEHGRDEHRQVAAPRGEDSDERDGADERSDEDGGGQPMGVLDPGVEVGGRQPIAKAERPIRAAETRVGGTHQPADGDQDEGGHGSGDRQLGESGHIGFLSPLIGAGRAGAAMIAAGAKRVARIRARASMRA